MREHKLRRASIGKVDQSATIYQQITKSKRKSDEKKYGKRQMRQSFLTKNVLDAMRAKGGDLFHAKKARERPANPMHM